MTDDMTSPNPSGDWIDASGAEPDRAAISSLGPADRRAFADQLFVSTLLDHVVGGQSLESDRLVDAVLRNVGGETTPPVPKTTAPVSSRRRWFMSALTVTAGVVGVAIVWVANEATLPTAQAAVEQAIRQANRLVDRHYRVTVDLGPLKPIQADLYLRGRDRVALHAHLPLDPWLGSDGETAWLAPKIGPVFVFEDVFRVQERISNVVGVPLPFLRISNVLGALSQDYDLRLVGSELLDGVKDVQWRRVEATLRPGLRPFAPGNVEFWADPESGDIGRLVLDWSGQIEHLAVRRIEFRLVDKQERSPMWYQHAAHHQAGRGLIELRGHSSRANR